MNLQLKADFAQKCFEIFNTVEPLSQVVNEIEKVMKEYGLTYTTENTTTQITDAEGKTYMVSARDRFEAALDTEIKCVQQMTPVLTEHINFLHSFLKPEELIQKEIDSLKTHRGITIRRKYKENFKHNTRTFNNIIDDYSRRIKELEASLELAYA